MFTGRMEVYLHSDGLTQNKGGCLVRVRTQTDFAAKNKEFIEFSKDVAKCCFALTEGNNPDYQTVVDACVNFKPDFPLNIEQKRIDMEKFLKEKIEIDWICRLTLDDVKEIEKSE